MTIVPSLEPKSAFADRLGISRPRVSQLVKRGLPVTPEGLVRVPEALEWVDRNLDLTKRTEQGKGAAAGAGSEPADFTPDPQRVYLAARARREQAKADREELARDREAGRVVPKDTVRAALFDWSRAHRDGWIGWVSRIAPAISAEFGVETERVFPFLDKAVREQLDRLARLPAPKIAENATDDDDAR